MRPQANTPSWCKAAGLGTAHQTAYVGRAEGADTEEAATKLATAQALSQLTNELGMRVQSESTFIQREGSSLSQSHNTQ